MDMQIENFLQDPMGQVSQGLYKSSSFHKWKVMAEFAVDTIDLTHMEWSSNDSAPVIWDSPLEYEEPNFDQL